MLNIFSISGPWSRKSMLFIEKKNFKTWPFNFVFYLLHYRGWIPFIDSQQYLSSKKMFDGPEGHLYRVRCKQKISSIDFLSIALFLMFGDYSILLKPVSAQSTTESSANMTCEPACDRDSFCNATNSDMNASNKAYCVPCVTICPNTSESEVQLKFCQKKCPSM